MVKVLNKRRGETNGVYVGRPTKYGNPFRSGRGGTRDEVIAAYEKWIRSKPELMAQAKAELKGKNLICWCAPLRCHADVLLKIANEED